MICTSYKSVSYLNVQRAGALGGAGDSEDVQVFGCCCLISITVHALLHSCGGLRVLERRGESGGASFHL